MGNRNKRSVALNLKDPRGIDIVRKLIATADVVAENFRPGVMKKLGLDYDAAKAIKPDIIYAAGSGFGADGPYVNRPGQDLIIQAMSGLAAITGKRPTERGVGARYRRAVSCVIVKTKTRSKKSSGVVTRYEAPLIATF